MVAAAVVAVAPRLHLDDAVLVVQDAVLLLRAAAALVLLDSGGVVDVVQTVDLHAHEVVELVRPGHATQVYPRTPTWSTWPVVHFRC